MEMNYRGIVLGTLNGAIRETEENYGDAIACMRNATSWESYCIARDRANTEFTDLMNLRNTHRHISHGGNL